MNFNKLFIIYYFHNIFAFILDGNWHSMTSTNHQFLFETPKNPITSNIGLIYSNSIQELQLCMWLSLFFQNILYFFAYHIIY